MVLCCRGESRNVSTQINHQNLKTKIACTSTLGARRPCVYVDFACTSTMGGILKQETYCLQTIRDLMRWRRKRNQAAASPLGPTKLSWHQRVVARPFFCPIAKTSTTFSTRKTPGNRPGPRGRRCTSRGPTKQKMACEFAIFSFFVLGGCVFQIKYAPLRFSAIATVQISFAFICHFKNNHFRIRFIVLALLGVLFSIFANKKQVHRGLPGGPASRPTSSRNPCPRKTTAPSWNLSVLRNFKLSIQNKNNFLLNLFLILVYISIRHDV